ncbi:ATP-binding protein [Cellulomonas soli]|uniref:ATP-binding protein n=1 Tax=Cellulomonas soli TaxID=931535 RepID=UPI003F861223
MTSRGGESGTAGVGVRGWWGRSLRLRLTLVTAGLLCLALVAGAVALTAVLSRSRVAALDDIVRARATTVATLAAEDRMPDALPVAEPGEIVQVLDADGRVLATSPTASRTLPLIPLAEVTRLTGDAPTDQVALATTTASGYDGSARVAVVGVEVAGAPATVVASMPLQEVQGLLSALRVSLIGVVPVLTALLALAVWLALGRALHPVDQLRRAAEQVAVTGGPGALPVPRGDDELAALARTLNRMLDRLEEASARQRSFVADAAHELRSPIAALRATLDVARSHPDSYAPGELVEELAGETARMQVLVDDLLLLARVGSRPLRTARVDLREVVEQVLAAPGAPWTTVAGGVPGASGSSGVTVQVIGDGAATADAGALARAVRNLVENAARHAASAVQVTLDEGRVVVDDDGPGIAEPDRDRVFERFVRLDDSRQRGAGGAGLGLAIARELAREQGGDIRLTGSPTDGLRAVLTLPPG